MAKTQTQEPIVNEFPEGRKPVSKFALKVRKSTYSLDFLSSDKLEDVEAGIRETLAGVETGTLALCLAVYKIESEELYKQAGYGGYLEYVQASEDRLNIPDATLSDWRKIGEVFFRYQKELKAAGFVDRGSIHKLRFLEDALKRHPHEEVWPALINESMRTFSAWAKGLSELPSSARNDNSKGQEVPQVQVELSDRGIMVNGSNILNLPSELPKEQKEWLRKRLKELYQIEASGNMPYIVETQSKGEQRAIDNFLKKFRAKK